MTDREIAQRAAEELLRAAGIRLVIWVDDQAVAAADATAVGIVEVIRKAKPTVLGRVFEIPLDADPEVRARQVREHVASLEGVQVPAFLAKLHAQREKLREDRLLPPLDADQGAADSHDVFSSEIGPLIGDRLRVMTPEAWDENWVDIMKAAFEAAGAGSIPGLPHTLVLFDIDLSGSGRGKLVSKRDLGTNPIEFVAELKRVLLAPFAEKFSEICRAVLDAAHKFAAEQTMAVNVSDLAHSVIVLSHEEGVTEIDTLLRIYDSFFREEVRRQAAVAEGLDSTVEQLRAISKLAPAAKRATKYTTWEHQRREMYDNITEVNRLHMPVEVGDIFEFTLPAGQAHGAGGAAGQEAKQEGPELYVLVAQPCHTVVRGDGRRKLKRATLARVLVAPKQKGSSDDTYDLLLLGENGTSAFVDFSNTITIPFDVLDLCALRDDGIAALSMDDGEPAGILAGWKHRRAEVRKAIDAHVTFVRETFAQLAGEAAEFQVPHEPNGASPLISTVSMTGAKSARYNCRRVHRILMPRAAALLGKYANYVSQDVFGVDLTRDA